MSIMVCDHCGLYIDTDYDVEGVFTPTEFICFSCLDSENLLDDAGEYTGETTCARRENDHAGTN